MWLYPYHLSYTHTLWLSEVQRLKKYTFACCLFTKWVITLCQRWLIQCCGIWSNMSWWYPVREPVASDYFFVIMGLFLQLKSSNYHSALLVPKPMSCQEIAPPPLPQHQRDLLGNSLICAGCALVAFMDQPSYSPISSWIPILETQYVV